MFKNRFYILIYYNFKAKGNLTVGFVVEQNIYV